MSAVPIYKPQVETRPQLRVVPGTGPTVATQIVRSVLTFTLVALFVFGMSSLAGHVMVEKARREGIRAKQRLGSATTAQSVLAKQIEALSNDSDLEAWALRNGCVAPDGQFKPSLKNVVVASR